uniref:RNase H type-1 domain-containing protein n=1 Tax=Fagus sylvatica TaxID=28930 RepID=A0A2N9IY09_FAGSY
MIVVLRAQMTIEEQEHLKGRARCILINDGLESCGNSTIPLQAEAEALAWAVFVAADLGVERVTIESDSKSCMDCIHGAAGELMVFYLTFPPYFACILCGPLHGLAGSPTKLPMS